MAIDLVINIVFDLNMNASFNANVSSLLLQGKIIKKNIMNHGRNQQKKQGIPLKKIMILMDF